MIVGRGYLILGVWFGQAVSRCRWVVLEVVGAPPSEVLVRPISLSQGQRLQRITRTARNPVKLRRAIVVLASTEGQTVPDIAHLLNASQDYVRDVIYSFNAEGFGALNSKWNGRRTPHDR